MEVKGVIIVATVVIMMTALLFSAGSNVFDSASSDISDKGDDENKKADCVFKNPSQGDDCIEQNSMNGKFQKMAYVGFNV